MSAVYRSAMGKPVDMGSMVAKNEKVRAVGNMNVNARGDILDSSNNIIRDNTQRVKESYKNTVRNQSGMMPQAEEDTQPISRDITARAPAVPVEELSPEERLLEDEDEDFEK